MKSTQQLITEYFEKNPLLIELLTKELLNISQVAQGLQKKLEEETFKNINRNTITVAINRYKKSLGGTQLDGIKVDSIKGRYPVFWHYLKFKSYSHLIEFVGLVDISQDDLCIIKNNKLIVVAKTKEKNIRKNPNLLNFIIEQNYIDNLCEFKIEFPPKYITEAGLLYKITSVLFWKGYSIADINMIQNKVYIYTYERDFSTVLSLLRREFQA